MSQVNVHLKNKSRVRVSTYLCFNIWEFTYWQVFGEPFLRYLLKAQLVFLCSGQSKKNDCFSTIFLPKNHIERSCSVTIRQKVLNCCQLGVSQYQGTTLKQVGSVQLDKSSDLPSMWGTLVPRLNVRSELRSFNKIKVVLRPNIVASWCQGTRWN